MPIGEVGRILVFRFFEGDDLLDSMMQSVKSNGLNSGLTMLIGALKSATLGYYKDGTYKHIQLNDQCEIASSIGNISVDEDGEIVIHQHLVLSNEKGEAFGGHLIKGIVGATAELMIIEESRGVLRRVLDSKSKLKLLKPG